MAGDEDLSTQGRRRAALCRALSAQADLLVDLCELRFADASLMLDLAMLARRLRKAGRRMFVRGPQPQVQRLIAQGRPAPAARRDHRGLRARDGLTGPYPGRQPMLPLLLLLFIIVPIVEIYVIIQVGQAIGALVDVALLIADSIARLVAHALAGPRGLAALQRAPWARAVRPRARSPTARSCIFGGALLLTPGFFTDIFGALFLLPPTRAAIRAFLLRQAGRRFVVATPFGDLGGAAGRTRRPPRRRGDWDVEGTAHDVGRPRALRP